MLTTLTTARLCITPRAAALTLLVDPTLEGLYGAGWTGAEPSISEISGELDVRYRIRGRLQAVAPGSTSLALSLNPAVIWAIEVDGGVSGLRADLRDLRISSIAIHGGASDIDIDLPEPDGELVLRIEGGASNVSIRRPAEVPVVVAIDGGASRLRLDEQTIGALAGEIRLAIPAAQEAQDDDRVGVRVLGGASRLTIAAQS